MFRYTLALVLALSVTVGTCFAADSSRNYGVRYASEQVVRLPQDQHKPYLTVIGSPSDARYVKVVRWFEQNETLVEIKDQTHFNAIPTTSDFYRDRYAATTPALPCVRLQSSDGEPVCELAGADLPMTADALANALNTKSKSASCFRRGHQEEAPRSEGDPTPQPLPPVPEQREHAPWVLLGLLCAAASGAAVVKQYKASTTKASKAAKKKNSG